MRIPHIVGVAAAVLVASLAVFSAGPASAAIKCQGNFQVTKYGLVATPYCEEQQIARVARSYGWKVSPGEIGRNPLKKVWICQVLGGDVRLKGSCAGYAPEQYR